MLSWSAGKTGRKVDVAAIRSSKRDVGITGGRELIELGHAAVGGRADPAPVSAVAEVLGANAAVKAAAVAGAFEIFNRVVDAAGLPVGRTWRDKMQDTTDALALERFPHA